MTHTCCVTIYCIIVQSNLDTYQKNPCVDPIMNGWGHIMTHIVLLQDIAFPKNVQCVTSHFLQMPFYRCLDFGLLLPSVNLCQSESVQGTCNGSEEGGKLSSQSSRRSPQEGRIPPWSAVIGWSIHPYISLLMKPFSSFECLNILYVVNVSGILESAYQYTMN